MLSAAAFSFGFFCTANKEFDFSRTQIQTLTVTEKHSYAGSDGGYKLTAEHRSSGEEALKIRVDAEAYEEIQIGDRILAGTKKGAFSMEFYSFVGKAD